VNFLQFALNSFGSPSGHDLAFGFQTIAKLDLFHASRHIHKVTWGRGRTYVILVDTSSRVFSDFELIDADLDGLSDGIETRTVGKGTLKLVRRVSLFNDESEVAGVHDECSGGE